MDKATDRINADADLTSADLDATIRIVKAFYKMGQLNSMKHYFTRGNLSGTSRNSTQEEEFETIARLIEGMEIFERNHGRGSFLQLEHRVVVSLMKKNFYPEDVIQNAQKSSWRPISYPGWTYPGVVVSMRSSSTSSEAV